MAKTNRHRHRKSRSNNPIKLIVSSVIIAIIAGISLYAFDRCAAKNIDSDTEETKSPLAHIENAEYVKIPDEIPSQIKRYTGFTLSFNKENATPNWVCWELLAQETAGPATRSNKFWQDTDIDRCPASHDYTRSGYDRGHMVPAADQKWSQQAMTDCFVMANMCPQDHSLNSGAWNTLENKERQWAARDSALLIVAGPIYEKSDTRRIGDTGVRVPSAFFKVIAAPYLPSPRGIAFIYPNMSAPGNMQNYSMTINEVEEITGFDFFPFLPDEIEEAIESTTSFKEWNRPR